jgi:hypothetical protein
MVIAPACLKLNRVGNILAKTAAIRINLNIDGTPISSRSHTHPSHSKLSPISLASIFRCSSSSRNPVYVRRVDPSVGVKSPDCAGCRFHSVHHKTNTWNKTQEFDQTPQRALLTYGDPNVDEYGDPWYATGETDDDDDTSGKDVEDIQEEIGQR